MKIVRQSALCQTPLTLLPLLALLALPAPAAPAVHGVSGPLLPEPTLAEVRALLRDAAAALAPAGARIEVTTGALDARLRLAPCARIQPTLGAGHRPWGASRVGLRCTQGASAWNVFLPVRVQVLAPAVVGAVPLPAGTVIEPAHLRVAEVDWAAAGAPVAARAEALAGRTLARAVGAGQPLRASDLRARLWFAAGETVRIVASGAGFSVSGAGQALAAGIEGQLVRVRTDGGRIVSGQPAGERLVEVSL